MDVLGYILVIVICSLEYHITYRIKLLPSYLATMMHVSESLDYYAGRSGDLSSSFRQAALSTFNYTFQNCHAINRGVHDGKQRILQVLDSSFKALSSLIDLILSVKQLYIRERET